MSLIFVPENSTGWQLSRYGARDGRQLHLAHNSKCDIRPSLASTLAATVVASRAQENKAWHSFRLAHDEKWKTKCKHCTFNPDSSLSASSECYAECSKFTAVVSLAVLQRALRCERPLSRAIAVHRSISNAALLRGAGRCKSVHALGKLRVSWLLM